MDEFRPEYIEKSDLLLIISWNSWGIKRCPRTPCGGVQDPRQPLDDGQLWRESVNQLYENQMWVTFTSRLGQLLVPPWFHPPRITPRLTAERARHVGSHPGWPQSVCQFKPISLGLLSLGSCHSSSPVQGYQ